ncbi:adenosylcobinamide-phosphate synthase CbiB [Flavitalea sp. BT771]|uniref:adenosylcobinamide-phosphate synthase CbiB n=1 Tax=Flavitalea sp. BT771 TaxID=3063329 RepID=UPI0026E369FB|nr:adenosylcobinamide-phosphate synthase CbiB [Flavitalea sp. BT771]MDO6434092.1 adenosylcobinamide-phosphate synthase CbiB [Flavitalea sp. BT771]MDV6222992.1 adenosylcobinamide-phosphate synthase CbiB [Flavitalea sp. BT771]
MRMIIPLAAGYLLDLCLGDPAGWPHPIRLFGWLIAKGEAWLNKGSTIFLKGMAMTLVLCGAMFVFFWYLSILLWRLHPALYYIVSSLFVFYGLANRQLVVECRQVFTILQRNGTDAGRKQLSRIVGRDTSTLNPAQIRIAVMETLSENLSDGVIAPLFFYALAGVPGMMTYKMINTLDSMVGYRSPRYEQFGKFAARLDDVANFIPARLTALLMVLVTASGRGAQFMFRYGRRHKSPNAGYPEAALAGILDARFGGANIYQGVIVTKPFIGVNPRELSPEEIEKAAGVNHKTCLLMVILIICLNIL